MGIAGKHRAGIRQAIKENVLSPGIKPAFSAAEAPVLDPPAPAKLSREEARAEGRRKKAREAEEKAARELMEARKGRRQNDVIDGTGEYKLVPIDDLNPDPDNPRKSFAGIDELADSLKADGMLQPVVARIDAEGKLIIMYGERRTRAARAAGWQHVPTIIRYGVKDSSVLAKQLQENSHRKDLNPIEEARAIRRFMHEQKISTYLQAAQALGHAQSWVTNRMALLDLEEADQDKVASGAISIISGAALGRMQTGKIRKSTGGVSGRLGNLATSLPPQAHFSDQHPLSGLARSRCRAGLMRGESHRPIIGQVACGSCWEIAIRLDAQRNPLDS